PERYTVCTQSPAELSGSLVPAASVYQLLEELLVEVFDNAVDDYFEKYRDQMFDLRCVCLAWNHIIVRTPQSWVTIKGTDGTNWIQLTLERSNNQLLDNIYDAFGDLGDLHLFMSEVHRFKGFALRLPTASSAIAEEVMMTIAPGLTYLRLSEMNIEGLVALPELTMPVFAGQISQLRSL
ncbi:hypothetical protein FRB90_008728, partial [Tulasnella sp. 427]